MLVEAISYRKKLETADLAQAVRMAQNAPVEDFKAYLENLTNE